MKRRTACLALLPLILGALLANRTFYFWSVFVADYFLGNPSSFRKYRDQLLQEEYDAYPVKGFIKPQSMFEINATDYNFEAFKAATDNWRVPVILRGVFADAPMMKWTPETLGHFFSKQNNRTFLVVKKNDFNAKVEGSIFVHLDAEWMPFEQMVENVTKGGTNYLQNANFYFPQDLDLYNEIQLERSGFDRQALLVQMFLGKKLPGEVRGSGSPLHCAAGPNLFIQISSSKRWLMIHPKWSRYVMPNMFTYQVASGSIAGLTHQANKTHRWGNFPRWEGQVNPGDAVWIPGWFWHEVQNVPSDNWSLAVATRYSNFFQVWEANPLFTWMVDLGVKEKPCLPGTRFLCAALHPGVVAGGSLIQTASEVSHEAVEASERVRRRLEAGTLETDAE